MRQEFASIGIQADSLATGRRLALLEAASLCPTFASSKSPISFTSGTRSQNQITVLSARLAAKSSRLLTEHFPAGIDVDQPNAAESNRPQFLARLGLPPSARLIGTIDELDHDSRLIEVLWAIDQLRCVRDDVYLIVAGDGPQRPLFERYAALYQITERVRFLGWQCRPDALLSYFDLYCTAAMRPTVSLSLLEAMAAGLPIVATDTPAHREAVVPRQTGFLVDPRVRSELGRWCLKVIEDQELAAGMSAAAREHVREHFPLPRFVTAYRDLYRAAR